MATADEPDPTGTLRQIERFEALCKAVKAAHPGEIICHGANTASIFRYPQLHADMVRGGLALYGYPPVPEATGLQPAMRWVTRGIYVKTIAPGDRVSYGGTFVATRPTVVMTPARGLCGRLSPGESRARAACSCAVGAPILGRVCMDQMMVDVTDIPGAREGDEAVLLGRQGDEQIDAEEMAAWLDTISYEVLCSPSSAFRACTSTHEQGRGARADAPDAAGTERGSPARGRKAVFARVSALGAYRRADSDGLCRRAGRAAAGARFRRRAGGGQDAGAAPMRGRGRDARPSGGRA